LELIREQVINADPLAVWSALNDDSILKASIPGCESVERTDPDTIRAVVKIKVGPVGARFAGVVRFSDLRPPHGYKITFEGQGGAAGFAKGHAVVNLHPHEAGTTLLAYEAHAQVGGRLAQIGSRLIDNVAVKTAEEFFTAFSQQLCPTPESESPVSRFSSGIKPTGPTGSGGNNSNPLVDNTQYQRVSGSISNADLGAIKTSLSIIAGCSVVSTVAAVVYVLLAVL